MFSAAFDIDSNLGKLVAGFSEEPYRLESLTKTISDEMNFNTVSQMINEWEESVGIPDGIMTKIDNRVSRPMQVRSKFTNFGGIQVASDYIRLSALFGFTVTVTPGTDYWTTKSISSITRFT